MTINTDNLVSLTEANQNFSRVAREEAAPVDEALSAARRILAKHLPAFQELAK